MVYITLIGDNGGHIIRASSDKSDFSVLFDDHAAQLWNVITVDPVFCCQVSSHRFNGLTQRVDVNLSKLTVFVEGRVVVIKLRDLVLDTVEVVEVYLSGLFCLQQQVVILKDRVVVVLHSLRVAVKQFVSFVSRSQQCWSAFAETCFKRSVLKSDVFSLLTKALLAQVFRNIKFVLKFLVVLSFDFDAAFSVLDETSNSVVVVLEFHNFAVDLELLCNDLRVDILRQRLKPSCCRCVFIVAASEFLMSLLDKSERINSWVDVCKLVLLQIFEIGQDLLMVLSDFGFKIASVETGAICWLFADFEYCSRHIRRSCRSWRLLTSNWHNLADSLHCCSDCSCCDRLSSLCALSSRRRDSMRRLVWPVWRCSVLKKNSRHFGVIVREVAVVHVVVKMVKQRDP